MDKLHELKRRSFASYPDKFIVFNWYKFRKLVKESNRLIFFKTNIDKGKKQILRNNFLKIYAQEYFSKCFFFFL